MPSLKQAARSAERAGEPLPYMAKPLVEKGVRLRRGHLHVIASAPGGAKTTTAINIVLYNTGVPTLYLAMDGDANSMSTRVLQAYLGWTREAVEEEREFGSPDIEKAMDTIDWVRWDFPNTPDMEEVRDRVWAFAEIFGEFPHLIVVDNLMDVVFEQSAAAYTDAESALTSLARAANSAVLVLAHVNGMHEGGRDPIPLSGLMFKATKKASLIVTLHPGAFPSQLFVSILKNRDGPADPSGIGVRAMLTVDYSRMSAS